MERTEILEAMGGLKLFGSEGSARHPSEGDPEGRL
jgi:hypothetical protein